MSPRSPIIPGAALWHGLKVGLLGGSFNPAHRGHRHISLVALNRLGLDAVWWLVSPQNPLKSTVDMAPFETRLASAVNVSRHPRLFATDIEQRLDTRYTADTLAKLVSVMPRTRFVWLMGADNLVQFTKWQRWRTILSLVPIAIFDRPHYSFIGLTGKMAMRYRQNRLSEQALRSLAKAPPPAWTFVHCPKNPASATRIRMGLARAGLYADGNLGRSNGCTPVKRR